MSEQITGMTAELYKSITAIVDERVREIRVTREDFDELKGVVRELAQAQVRTEQRVGELAQAQMQLAQVQAKTEKEIGVLSIRVRELSTAVGRLTDTIGYGLEDLAQSVLPSYLERTYGVSEVEFSREFFSVKGEEVEINLYAKGKRDGKEIVLLGESKSRIRGSGVRAFLDKLSALEGFFDKPTFPFMFGYWIHPTASELAEENKIELIVTYKLTR